MGSTNVYSLGGSLIVPDNINADFLKSFKNFILSRLEKGEKAIVVCGGGKICRYYNKAAKEVATPTDEELDWLGIALTKVNAELVRVMFSDYAYEEIITNPEININTEKKVIIASGYKPGNSTDKVAVMLAKKFNASRVINMTNIDMVYDSDPKENANAKPIDEISTNEFLKLVGSVWQPGKNAPFDPVATRLAQEYKTSVVILNGKNIDNLNKFLNGEKFKGTMLKPD
ncbi:MAG: UMP kinase [Nanoarchaeota archaeon]